MKKQVYDTLKEGNPWDRYQEFMRVMENRLNKKNPLFKFRNIHRKD